MFSVITLITASVVGVVEDFSITVDSLGIGNTWSAGVVTPLHITVTSNRTEATAAWIQWEVPDADGDTVLWGKPMTLTPEGKTSTWLYAPLRPWADSTFSWSVRLMEWNGSQPMGELATTRFTSNSVRATQFDSTQSSIAIFGSRRLGLAGYQTHRPTDVKQESSTIVSGLTNDDLPDAWAGLEGLDVIVWADSQPQFTFRQEIALQNWVERGGHLVISLPMIGDPWNLGSENGPLSNLIGDIQPKVKEIPIWDLDQVLGRNQGWPSINITARTFNINNLSQQSDLYPIITLPNNEKVVGVQRRVGFGAVTILGIDLTSGQLASLGLPETDVFWNRILGRRSDTPSQITISKLNDDERLSKTIPTESYLSTGNLVAQEIAMSTTAGGRLGTVFILILIYWLVSGPIGYFLLRRKQKQRWAWVSFAMLAVTFSFVTWGLASTTTNIKTPLKHVTIVDHVYGGNGQRAIGWCSIYLPTFGISSVQLGGAQNNLLLPWTSPNAYLTPPFVDHREIVVNLDRIPNTFDQPSRATTANFSYDWIGGIDNPFYNSLIRVMPDDEPTCIKNHANQPFGTLRGTIVNNITKPIRDVTIIWVTDQRNPLSSFGRYQDDTIAPWIERGKSGQPLNRAFAWRVSTWGSGQKIDFSLFDATPTTDFSVAMRSRYQPSEQMGRNMLAASGVVSKKDWRTKLEMLSLYSHLEPPTYQRAAGSKQSPQSHRAIRIGGHDLDFADWFGRPCIIVMGFVQNAPIPVPISVNGEQIMQSSGETFVRWVYPLWDMP